METESATPKSLNFAFLAAHEPLLARYAAQAERYVFEDPNAALIKLRQLIEGIAQLAAAHLGWAADGDARLLDILRHLRREDAMAADVADAFHHIRKAGNRAVHHHEDSRAEAFRCLRMARTVAVWYVRAFGTDRRFNPGPFVPPPDPAEADRALLDELNALRNALAEERAARTDAEDLVEARQAAEAHARAAWGELAAAIELAADAEQERDRTDDGLRERVRSVRQREGDADALQAARDANLGLALADHDVRAIVDQQLRDAGWECDSQSLTHALGATPVAGRARAIAQWPCTVGHADYVLFAGLTPLGTIEVDRRTGALPAALQQAAARARHVLVQHETDQVAPFAFATSGGLWRPELPSESGIWFDDVRDLQTARPIASWPRPEDLVRRAEPSTSTTLARALALRPHIDAAVSALVAAEAPALALLAAGSGRSFAALALVERLLHAHPSARVLLLAHVGGGRPEEAFDAEALATIRACGRVRIGDLADVVMDDPADAPPNALAYEYVVVDECSASALFAPPWDALPPSERVARYQHALARFDAALFAVAASAEPHTEAVFGPPIHAYTVEDAVADGWLRLPAQATTLRWTTPRYGALEGASLIRIPESAPPGPQPAALERDDIGARVLQPAAEAVLANVVAQRVDPWTGPNALVVCGGPRHASLVALSLEQALEERFGADIPPVVVRPASPSEATQALHRERVAIVVAVDALCSNLVDAPVGLMVFASAVTSIAHYADRMGAASRTRPFVASTRLEVVHAFERIELSPFPDANRSALPPVWAVDGDGTAAIDGRSFTADVATTWGRQRSAAAHLEAFWSACTDGDLTPPPSSEVPTRARVRPLLRAWAEGRFSTDSLASAAAAEGFDVVLPLVAWAACAGLPTEEALRRASALSSRWDAHQRAAHWALCSADAAAPAERVAVYARAARRDGFLDEETPEVIRLGGATVLERAIGRTLDALRLRLIPGPGPGD